MKTKINLHSLAAEIKSFFANNARTIAVFLVCFGIGAVIGIATSVKLEEFEKINVIEQLKLGEYSMSGSFFRALAYGAIGAAIAYMSVFKRAFALASALWLIYIGYRFGLLAVGACNVSLITGLVCCFLLYAPVYLGVVLLVSATVVAASEYWLAKNAALTCKSSLTALAIKTGIYLAVFALAALFFCVIAPWLLAVIFL